MKKDSTFYSCNFITYNSATRLVKMKTDICED